MDTLSTALPRPTCGSVSLPPGCGPPASSPPAGLCTGGESAHFRTSLTPRQGGPDSNTAVHERALCSCCAWHPPRTDVIGADCRGTGLSPPPRNLKQREAVSAKQTAPTTSIFQLLRWLRLQLPLWSLELLMPQTYAAPQPGCAEGSDQGQVGAVPAHSRHLPWSTEPGEDS